MVDTCANPGCRAELKALNCGDLYALERRSADTEFFWMCSACAPEFDLQLSGEGRVSFRPRSARWRARPADREATLRLVSSSGRRMPWRETVPSDEPRVSHTFSDWARRAS